MEHEMLFTASKWEIFKLLSEEPLSPIELAKRSGTSVANISQQLRLLEIAGLVKSEKIPNRDRGQPRVLYSLSGNKGYIISASNDFVEKKLINLSTHNQIIMKIWFYPEKSLHYFLEKAFWKIEEHLKEIDGIAIDMSSNNPLNIIIFTRNPELNKKLKHLRITRSLPDFNREYHKGILKKHSRSKNNQDSRQVFFITYDSDKKHSDLKKIPLYSLYDPEGIISKFSSEDY